MAAAEIACHEARFIAPLESAVVHKRHRSDGGLMLIDSRTLFAPIIAECLALFLATGLLAYRSESNRSGLGWLAAALGLMACAFGLIALRGIVHPLLSVWFANICIAAATTMGTLAIASFQKLHLPAALIWGPALVIAVSFLLFLNDITIRLSVATLVHVVQNAFTMSLIWKARQRIPGVGKYLVLGGTLINSSVLVLRVLSSLAGLDAIHEITDSTVSQGIVYFSIFITLNLSPVGYILMDKETDDQRYRHLALRDRLTQCWNRAYLEQTALAEMERFKRYGSPIAMVILDIDLFKSVNDKFGHATGDKVLKGFAHIARTCIRNTDVLARWGGEEFIVLLPSSGLPAAACIAERIRQAVIAQSIAGIQLSVSAGYAVCNPDETWDAWFQRADNALYRAKAQGRNRVEAGTQNEQPFPASACSACN